VDERGGLALVFKVNPYFSLSGGYTHIATQPTAERESFETRLNFAASVRSTPLRAFILSDRNLLERRLRAPENSTRYRNRLMVERPVEAGGRKLTLFFGDEIFYDWSANAWVRNRFQVGNNIPLDKRFSLDLYYLRQNDGRSRPGDLHVVGTTLKVKL
jgi:hypothetical protein